MAKPHRMYRKIDQKAYCRKEYIRANPQVNITKFQQGNLQETKTKYFVEVICLNNVQVRNYSIESFRRSLTKKIASFSSNLFYFKFKIYPHIFIRENTYNIRAGADRTSTGMREAFGKIIGLCSRVKKNQVFISARFHEKIPLPVIKEIFKKIKSKICIKYVLKISERK